MHRYRKCRCYLCIAFSASAMCLILLNISELQETRTVDNIRRELNQSNDVVLNMFKWDLAVSELYKDDRFYGCVRGTRSDKGPICIYKPAVDFFMSSRLTAVGHQKRLDTDYVDKTKRLLQTYPDMVFLDIGCSIGLLTVRLAAAGRKVLAIDANKQSLKLLSNSLHLGHLHKKVIVMWNAVSDKKGKVKLEIPENNINGAFVRSVDDAGENLEDNETVSAVTLDDTLRILEKKKITRAMVKLDIEGDELKALEGGKVFLDKIDVPYFLMDWMWFQTEKMAAVGKEVVLFMYTRNYEPYDFAKDEHLLDKNTPRLWPRDILWIKRNATRI